MNANYFFMIAIFLLLVFIDYMLSFNVNIFVILIFSVLLSLLTKILGGIWANILRIVIVIEYRAPLKTYEKRYNRLKIS